MNLLEPTLMESLQQFHFIRPYWLGLMVPALLMAAFIFIRAKNSSAWQTYIDPELLTPLLKGRVNQSGKKLPLITLIFWLLCAFALAGPTWNKLPTPIEKKDTALIILLDLSPSMLANDVKPSRLIVARHKILDLLKLRREGNTALIGYSGDAHIVSPLTDDTKTITNLLNVLEPGIMPVYGSNVEDAFVKAQALFKNAGYTQGNILLVTDGITEQALSNSASLLKGSEFTLSIIGVGSEDGAPIPDNSGGFIKDSNGVIIIPRLHETQLRSFANKVNGYYSHLQLDDRDIQPLVDGTNLFNQNKNKKTEREFDQWRDTGGIFSLLLLPLLLMAFRRGVILCLLLAIPLMHTTKAEAEEAAQNGSHISVWDSLWLNDNQRAMKAMKKHNYEAAAKGFKNPDWKAAAQYEAGDYSSALKQFQADPSNEGLYNQGNALAKSGQLEDAINAYKEALKKNPQFDDAAYNKKIVEDLLSKQQKQPPKEQQEQFDDKSPSQENNNKQDKNQSGNEGDNNSDDKNNQQNQDQAEQQKAHEEKDKTKSDAEANKEKSDSGKDQPDSSPETRAESKLSPEEKQALEQWLRQVPDDPSGLLRNKFEYYYQQRLQDQKSGNKDKQLNDEERW